VGRGCGKHRGINSDCRNYQAFALKVRRNSLQSIPGGAGDSRGFGVGVDHERIEPRGADKQVPQEFPQPAREIHSGAESARGCFPASDGTEDKWNSQAAHERRLTKGNKGDVMNEVEGHHLMKLARAVISPKLPGQVVEIEAAGPMFPLSAPCRKVMVRNGYGNRERLNFPLDDCPVVFARDHRDVVTLPDELKHPVPSDSGLRALMGLTGVGGKKNLHR